MLVHVESIDAFFIQRLTCGIKGGVEIHGLLPPQVACGTNDLIGSVVGYAAVGE